MVRWLVRYEVTLTTDNESRSFRFTDMKKVRWALRLASMVEGVKADARDRWTGRTLTP